MAVTSLVKAKEELARFQRSNALNRVKRKSAALGHTLVAAGTGYAIGTIERNATAPLPTIFGLDPKLTWGAVTSMIAVGVSGRTGQILAAMSDGLLTSYGYHQGLGSGYTLKGEEGGDLEF